MSKFFRFFGKAILFVLIFAVIVRIITVMGATGEDLLMEDTIAVVRLEGVIMDTRYLDEKLKSLDENEKIKGVILEINSPGGAIAPTQQLYLRIMKMHKPVYAVMESVAASGGYYTAAACDKIFAMESTITGSIGVIMEYTNFRGLMDKFGVQSVVIKSGKMKDVPSPTRELTEEEQKYLQSNINDFYEQFLRDILKRRKIDEKKLRELADGRVFSGRQAKQYDLIDTIGTREEAENAMKKQLDMPDIAIEEFYEPEQSLIRTLLSQAKSITQSKGVDGGIYYLYRPGF
ncbi:signal peptide peptidase SppA [Seleniivibrio woodruffii]|uniref:Signal peptide peptidase A n=1 Tax=Seleniivibrio woodruffii TaxID=1078050 RepID=A0A4R1KBA1_9BACT|nr:signal peptide peptidase SppA [Seleniivibrio woodruffii]TCK61828.1 signal peptide peptidase A [Seleniivibrio woodruffii]TVZ35057.1 protease-4 [Seleniivibrio woodruffii]